jgi:nucleoside-diphosphate-sugar epimerase
VRAAVTGAAGFLGAHLVRRLAADGTPVRALVWPEAEARKHAHPYVDVVAADVRSSADLESAFEGCSIVYHLAAQTSLALTRRELFEANVDGTRNVASAAARVGVSRVVLASNLHLHVRPAGGLIDEEAPIRPANHYGASKLRAERTLLEAHRRSGLGVVLARVGPTLGVGAVRWLGLLRAIDSGSYRIVGPGVNRIHPVDVSDAADALIRCARTDGIDGRAYVIAGKESVPTGEFIEMIAKELGVTVGRSRIPGVLITIHRVLGDAARRLGLGELPFHDTVSFFKKDVAVDCSRAEREIGYRPVVPLDESIRSMVRWYRGSA